MIKKFLLLAILGAIFACEPDIPPVPESPLPTEGSVTEDPTSSETSPDNTPKVAVQLIIQDQNNKRVSGATVTITSDQETPQSQQTDAGGGVLFENLRLNGSYTFEVSASGYAQTSRSANLSQLGVAGDPELLLGIILKALDTAVSGQVVDLNGQPIANAAVFDSQQTQLTNQNGEFVLAYDQKSSLQLVISKVGYQGVSQSISIDLDEKKDLGKLTLPNLNKPVRIGIDATHHTLGSSDLTDFQGLQQAYKELGYEVDVVNADLAGHLDQLDVLLVLSPASDFDIEESSAIQAFVRSGHSLLVSGEWAGFAGFSGGAANQLLQPFGLQFGFDTLRENGSGFFQISQIENHFLTQGISALQFYQPASVLISATDKGGQILARTSSDAFRISNNQGSFGLLAVTAFGSGKVMAVGDTSFMSDLDSDGDGTSNLNEGQNLVLLKNMITW